MSNAGVNLHVHSRHLLLFLLFYRVMFQFDILFFKWNLFLLFLRPASRPFTFTFELHVPFASPSQPTWSTLLVSCLVPRSTPALPTSHLQTHMHISRVYEHSKLRSPDIKGNMRVLLFWEEARSLNARFSGSIHFPVNLIFINSWIHSLVSIDYVFIIQSPADGHLGCSISSLLWKVH